MKVLDQKQGKGWIVYHGDSVEVTKGIPDSSIDYQIFSPPFSSLYTYSNSPRDMGNCKGLEEFIEHYKFLIKEQYRIHRSGRLLSFHCMNLPTSKVRDGYIGIRDFRGDLIRMYEAEGWIYHSEVVIWKNPVTAMQRTKALGLLHKQLIKDSSMSRQGIPDYLVTMRKPGKNESPVNGELQEFNGEDPPVKTGIKTRDSINFWQRYASPVWMDINLSDTLQYQSARDNNDERHICPLQLDVIRRGIQLWTNPQDVVLDPFSGIGSVGHVCLEMNRQYLGIELKESYFKAQINNIESAEVSNLQGTLFAC